VELWLHPEECLRAVVLVDNIAFLAPPEKLVMVHLAELVIEGKNLKEEAWNCWVR
jgi:hypothetical protein